MWILNNVDGRQQVAPSLFSSTKEFFEQVDREVPTAPDSRFDPVAP